VTAQAVSKLEAALVQLDYAIACYQDGGYIPAITLAGAAEELLAGVLGPDEPSAFVRLRDRLASTVDMPPKLIADRHLNSAKIWLKHTSGNDSERIDLRNEATQMIVRAITNLVAYDRRHNTGLAASRLEFKWVKDAEVLAEMTPEQRETIARYPRG
jgi:hypothetical protein